MRIGVVGGGIAGLRSAMLLERAGHQVTVFEARDRVGGRLLTVERGDGWYEGGGEWIDADHQRVLALMREFGIAPEKSSQWPGLVVCNGEFALEDSVWPDAAHDSDAVHLEAVRLIGEVKSGKNLGTDGNLGDFLDRVCQSERGRWWAEATSRSDEGDDTGRIGFRGWLRGYEHYLNRSAGDMSLYRIGGGGGRLCALMAQRLADVRTGWEVSGIDPKTATVDFYDHQPEIFDRVVVALPSLWAEFRVGMVEFTGAQMGRAIKVVLEFDRPWWKEKGWSGRMICDLPVQQTWDIGRGGLHALGCYICGDEAAKLGDDAVQAALESIVKIHPEASRGFLGGAVHDWPNEKGIDGAFPSIRQGEFEKWEQGRQPWEKLHFAGDWACDWIGFIEGALESAERVATEIGPAPG